MKTIADHKLDRTMHKAKKVLRKAKEQLQRCDENMNSDAYMAMLLRNQEIWRLKVKELRKQKVKE